MLSKIIPWIARVRNNKSQYSRFFRSIRVEQYISWNRRHTWNIRYSTPSLIRRNQYAGYIVHKICAFSWWQRIIPHYLMRLQWFIAHSYAEICPPPWHFSRITINSGPDNKAYHCWTCQKRPFDSTSPSHFHHQGKIKFNKSKWRA